MTFKMNITKIELVNFRNYKKKIFDNFSNLNIIIGKNGVGKTSIVEAIYLGSLAKSFKTNNDESIINLNEKYFKIKIHYFDDNYKKNLELYYDQNGKKTKINSKTQKRLSDFISQYRVILVSPDELKLVKSSPNTRRNYLNIQLSQLHKEYIYYLNNYNNMIKNKNDYLKKLMLNSNLDERYLDILDEKIVEEGLKIFEYRKNYIELINKYIEKIVKNEYNIKPILLLDDLFSELDEKNRNNIFKSLDKEVQIFITTTDLKSINKRILNKAKIFNLDERM